MLPQSPLQLRLALALVDRGLDRVQKLIVNRDPDTAPEHLILRALAYCLFYDEGLRLADGPPRRDLPDLSVVNGEGKVQVWIACGAADAEEVRRVMAHNRGVVVHALFDAEAPRDHFLHQVACIKKRPPGFDELSIWFIDSELVTELAARPELRQRWDVTLVGDHLYVDSGGVKADSPVTRLHAPPFTP